MSLPSNAVACADLLPCPFCSSEARLHFKGNDLTKRRELTVACPGCRVQLTHASPHHGFDWLQIHAVASWNQRTPPKATP